MEEQLAARLGKTAEAEAEENDPEVKRRKVGPEAGVGYGAGESWAGAHVRREGLLVG